MAYTATYATTDVAPVVIDILVGLLVAIVGFATIMGLAFAWRMISNAVSGRPLFSKISVN